jgi:hypothetical protein
MSTQQAASKQTKRDSGQKIFKALFVAAIAVAVLSSGIIFAASTQIPQNSGFPVTFPHHQNVVSGPLVLNPNGYYLTGFAVPKGAKTASLNGNFSVTGNSTNNGVVITVWSQKEFLNYFGCQNAVPVYNKDMFPMAEGNINVSLSSGAYLILVGGAGTQPKTVQFQLDLNCT